jgi:hypothetical protein
LNVLLSVQRAADGSVIDDFIKAPAGDANIYASVASSISIKSKFDCIWAYLISFPLISLYLNKLYFYYMEPTEINCLHRDIQI